METSKSLRRYLAEGVVIVLSILVAFTIDASWDQWKEGQEEQRVLAALFDELDANRARLTKRTQWHENVQLAIDALLAQAAESEPMFSADSIDVLIGKASWFNNSTTFEMSASDALVLGGMLPLVANAHLRQRITGWNREVANVTRTENQDYDTFSDVWMPFLRDHGYLPQIANAITMQPSGEVNYGGKVPLVTQGADHRELLRDRRFQNVLLHRRWVQIDILYVYAELEPKLSALVTLLADEIGG